MKDLDLLWKIGTPISRFGWWFVSLGAAIAGRNPANLPWLWPWRKQ